MRECGNDYYLVPIDSSFLCVNGESFLEIIKYVDEDLYDRIVNRVPLLSYDWNSLKIFKNYNKKILSSLRKNDLPEHIVLVYSDEGLYEFETHTFIDCNDNSYLYKHIVSPDVVLDYLIEKKSYSLDVNHFFNSTILSSEKIKCK